MGYGGERVAPITAHDIERISCRAVHAVVCAVHHKLHPFGNRAEFADNQFIADKIIMVGDVMLKLGGIVAVIIGIIADNNVRVFHYIFDIAKVGEFFVGERFIGVRYMFHTSIIKYLRDYCAQKRTRHNLNFPLDLELTPTATISL